MKKRWLLVLFLVGAAILTAGTFNRASAEEQWQEWGKGIYRVETEHFIFLSHVDPGKKENDKRAIDTVARAEEFFSATTKYVQTDNYDGKLGIFIELAGQKNWLSDKQIADCFDEDTFYGWVYPFGGLDHTVAQLITRMWLRLKLLDPEPDEWLDYGLSDYIFWREIEQKPWAEIRRKVDVPGISDGLFNLNTMANPTNWSRKPGLSGTVASVLNGMDPYRMSIFYFLESRYGTDKIKTFLDGCERNVNSSLTQTFAPKKALEAEWRLFVLFSGVTNFKWQESRGDYRTQQPGVEIRLKKGKTFWYNAKTDEAVAQLARAVGATNEILGLTPADPRKIPVITVEFSDRYEQASVKQSGGGFSIRAKDAGVLQSGTETVAEAYVGQAIQRAGLKLPQWAGEGLKSYLSSQAGSFEAFRLSMDGWTVKQWSDMNTLDDSKAIASLFWFVDAHYGHKAVAALLGALSSGSPLEGAVAGATGSESSKVYRAWIRALVLPEKPSLNWKETQNGFEAQVPGLVAALEGSGRLVTISQSKEASVAKISRIMEILKGVTGYIPSADVKVSLVPADGLSQGKVEQTGLTVGGDLNDEYAVRLVTRYWLTRLTAGRIDSIPAWLGEGLTVYVLDQSNGNAPAKIRRDKAFTDFDAWKKPWNPETKYTAIQSDCWGMTVRYIVDRYGASSQKFFALAGQKGVEAALKEALTTDFDTLAKDWQASLKE